jgi:L-amino acid N-acyltransferase YncA
MNTYAIRPAYPEDATEIARIGLYGPEAASGLPGPTPDVAITGFSNRILHPQDKSGIWVAERDDTILGWRRLFDRGVTQNYRVSQSSTYIAKDWHAKGVGRALLQFAKEQALQRSFDTIVGWIKTDKVSSLKVVQSLGWAYVGICPGREIATRSSRTTRTPCRCLGKCSASMMRWKSQLSRSNSY